jgi:PhnB protein
VNQLQYRGVAEYRAAWESGFRMTSGPMIFEPREMEMRVSGDLAACHGFIRCGGTGEDGREMSSWFRATILLERRDGKWLIAHEHHSVPFEMESGAGLFALAPD